jgi:hypothetical protein
MMLDRTVEMRHFYDLVGIVPARRLSGIEAVRSASLTTQSIYRSFCRAVFTFHAGVQLLQQHSVLRVEWDQSESSARPGSEWTMNSPISR